MFKLKNRRTHILEYLGIEKENQKKYWKEIKKDVINAISFIDDARADLQYCLIDDFGVYCSGRLVKQFGEIVVYEVTRE